MATKEFFEEISAKLVDEGGLMFNVAAVSQESEMLKLMRNTVTAAFGFVYEYREPNSYNSIIFAFKEEPDLNSLKIAAAANESELNVLLTRIFAGLHRIENDQSAEIATDNRSAIEFLTEKMVLSEAL